MRIFCDTYNIILAQKWLSRVRRGAKKEGGPKPVFLFLLSPVQGNVGYERDSSF